VGTQFGAALRGLVSASGRCAARLRDGLVPSVLLPGSAPGYVHESVPGLRFAFRLWLPSMLLRDLDKTLLDTKWASESP